MAENIYSRLDISDEERETLEEEDEIYKQIEIEELNVVERERKSVICESCVSKRFYESVAVFLCFVCEIYVCQNCLPEHESHKGMNVWRKESERENGRETSESDRMGEQDLSGRTKNKGKGLGNRMEAGIESEEGEKSEIETLEEECDRKISLLLDDLMTESETERIEKFENSHLSIIDRIEVKHEMDQKDRTGCWITGLCGVENKRLVVCDFNNYCIKIFKLGSHVLQRYIRFVGSGPWDVTDIDLKQNSTEPNLVSGSSSDISVTDRADPNKQCLIAVTLPWECQIMFIDLSKKPAKSQKIIQTEGECYFIQFYDDKIFTVCREDLDNRCSVYIYSTDGDTLNKFDTDIYEYVPGPYLAVVSGRVYLTDGHNNKVQYRNVEGQVTSEITIEGSVPEGISVDSDNNIYVCAWDHETVYRLDADLTRYMSVLDQTTDYIGNPDALCYYRDKLYISHVGPSPLHNFVTVVRLL